MKRALYFLASIIIILVVAYLIVLNLPKASSKNKEAEFKLASVELYSEYATDESLANTKYNGKVIEVTGKILDISEDQQGATVIILDAQDDFGGVLCTLESKPKNLPSPGEQISIKGQCNGLLMDVVLNKCVITGS